MINIPYNKPFLTGKEIDYIKQAIDFGKISGNGFFTKNCQDFFIKKWGFPKSLLTTSCTDALEMASLLFDIQPGDEIIIPSYTFVSTANPFIMRGGTIIFADSNSKNPNIDPEEIKKLITQNTKVIVVVHYAGIACDMEKIKQLCDENNIFLLEDAAQAIDSYYNGIPLGSFGDLSAFSFHETKNIISGEGGLLVINNPKFFERAEILWEKGTNRSAFFKGETDKYGWIDVGSSFLPSEIIAAFLYAQLENLDTIQSKRKKIWQKYYDALFQISNSYFTLPYIPQYATNNAHIFYIVWENYNMRDNYLEFMKKNGILAVFHYQSLHSSPFFKNQHNKRELKNADIYSHSLVRLPLYYELSEEKQNRIINETINFLNKIG